MSNNGYAVDLSILFSLLQFFSSESSIFTEYFVFLSIAFHLLKIFNTFPVNIYIIRRPFGIQIESIKSNFRRFVAIQRRYWCSYLHCIFCNNFMYKIWFWFFDNSFFYKFFNRWEKVKILRLLHFSNLNLLTSVLNFKILIKTACKMKYLLR